MPRFVTIGRSVVDMDRVYAVHSVGPPQSPSTDAADEIRVYMDCDGLDVSHPSAVATTADGGNLDIIWRAVGDPKHGDGMIRAGRWAFRIDAVCRLDFPPHKPVSVVLRMPHWPRSVTVPVDQLTAAELRRHLPATARPIPFDWQ